MQSVTRIGTSRPFLAAGGLRKARNATLAAVMLAASLGTAQGAWAADSLPTSPAAPAVTPSTVTAVRVTTSMGAFVIELNAERAPLTVQNFVRYVNEGFYSNTLIHRVVGGFVVQGGGFDATTMKTKATHEYIVNESGNGLQNKRGAVGMARSGPPHSANSQFYVNLVDNGELDPLPTRWGYTVFGQVIEGMEVLERIGVVATGSMGPFKSEAPLKPIVIEKVEPLGNAPAPAAVTPPPAATPPPPAPSGEGASGEAPPPPQ
jgi:peptidyl-prolyl cis-trans isomerase A (cyclophilin A)